MKRIKYLSCVFFITFIFLTGCSGNEEIISMSGTHKEALASGDISISSDMSSDYAYNDGDLSVNNNSSIYVFICGEIERPGVYEMPDGSRVYELINRAGGITPGGAVESVNQAEALSDSQQIYIPSKEEAKSKAAVATSGSDGLVTSNKSLININTADEATLQQINGIGASRAADIVAYRNSSGGFNTIEDIMKVPGIKDGLFSKIKDQITVK